MTDNEHGKIVFPDYPVLLVDDEEHFLHSMYMTLKTAGISNVEKCQDSRPTRRLQRH